MLDLCLITINIRVIDTHQYKALILQLEQLECLHSEDYPCCHMITHTIDQFILDPKSKQDKVKVKNSKHLRKLQINQFWIKFTYDTSSEVAW